MEGLKITLCGLTTKLERLVLADLLNEAFPLKSKDVKITSKEGELKINFFKWHSNNIQMFNDFTISINYDLGSIYIFDGTEMPLDDAAVQNYSNNYFNLGFTMFKFFEASFGFVDFRDFSYKPKSLSPLILSEDISWYWGTFFSEEYISLLGKKNFQNIEKQISSLTTIKNENEEYSILCGSTLYESQKDDRLIIRNNLAEDNFVDWDLYEE